MGRQAPAGLVSLQLATIAQISDPHVGVGAEHENTARALAQAVAATARIDPQPIAVLLTGDLTHDGAHEEYELVRELLSPLPMPVHPIPGNHDRRENLRAAFSVTVLGLLIGAIAFAVSLVRDRLYAQDLSDLEYVATTLEPEPR